MIENINVRFFVYCLNNENEVDVEEITENQFLQIECLQGSIITYERHTVHENGVRQICLSVENPYYPHIDELERVIHG